MSFAKDVKHLYGRIVVLKSKTENFSQIFEKYCLVKEYHELVQTKQKKLLQEQGI